MRWYSLGQLQTLRLLTTEEVAYIGKLDKRHNVEVSFANPEDIPLVAVLRVLRREWTLARIGVRALTPSADDIAALMFKVLQAADLADCMMGSSTAEATVETIVRTKEYGSVFYIRPLSMSPTELQEYWKDPDLYFEMADVQYTVTLPK